MLPYQYFYWEFVQGQSALKIKKVLLVSHLSTSQAGIDTNNVKIYPHNYKFNVPRQRR